MKLKEEVEHLNDSVGVLTLENAGLSGRTTELGVDLVAENTTRGELEKDVSWIHNDGLSRVVDRVTEIPQVLQGLVQVRVACVAAGLE